MRIAVISDTHLRTEEQVLEHLWGHLHGVDSILHAGDVTTVEVARALARIAPLTGVAGNMDAPGLSSRWPSRRILELGPYRVGLTHGSGPPHGLATRVRRSFGLLDAVIFGHSHHALLDTSSGTLLLNPGSPTRPPAGQRPSYALLHVGMQLRAELVQL